MAGRVNHDSVAPVHGNTSTQQNEKYTAPDCSDSPTPYSACRTALPAVRSAYSCWRFALPFLARSLAYMLAARISPAEIPCRRHATLTGHALDGPRSELVLPADIFEL